MGVALIAEELAVDRVGVAKCVFSALRDRELILSCDESES